MEIPEKTNRLALASFAGGLMILICTGLLVGIYNFMEPSRRLIGIADGILLPLRNLSVIFALAAGILALRDIRSKAGVEKGVGFAWVGIAIGAGWILIGILVGLAFLVGEVLH